jgi:hypothetical protein
MQTTGGRLYLKRERPAGIQFAQRDDLLTVRFRHFFSLDPYFLTRFSMRVDHLDGELGLHRDSHAGEGTGEIRDQFPSLASLDPDTCIGHLIDGFP